jgi:hypothetical protein
MFKGDFLKKRNLASINILCVALIILAGIMMIANFLCIFQNDLGYCKRKNLNFIFIFD